MIDLLQDRKKLLELYRPGADEFSLVDVPELPFAMVDGEGPPENGAGVAIKALFQAIQPIRRATCERMGKAFVEPPAEMLYWADNAGDLAAGRKDRWRWRATVTLPAWIDAAAFANSFGKAREHMDAVPPTLRFARFAEGRCAQIMHVGSADGISALLHRLYSRFLPEQGLAPYGACHEIYLDDWSRVAPQKRNFILRQPVRSIAKTERKPS